MANQNVNVNFRGTDDISAKIERLEKRFSDLNKRLKNTSRRGKEVGDNFKKMKRDSDGLSRSLKRVGGILAGAFAIRTVKNAVDLGVAVKDVRQQFELLVRNNRGNPNTFLAQLRRTAQGTISDFGLLQAAAQGLGRSLSLDEVNAAVGASITIAAQQGKAAATALEEIISAMITLSAQRLDNIGITPAQLRGLDDAQKKLVVIQRLQELALQAPSIAANQAYKQLNAQLENLRNNISAAIVSSEAFGRIVDRLNNFFTAERVNKWANAIERGINALVDFAEKNPTLVKALAAGAAINIAGGGAPVKEGFRLLESGVRGAASGLTSLFGGFIGAGGYSRVEAFLKRVFTSAFKAVAGLFRTTNRFDLAADMKLSRADRAFVNFFRLFVGNNDRIAKSLDLKPKVGGDLFAAEVNKTRTLGRFTKAVASSGRVNAILLAILATIDTIIGFAKGLKARGQNLGDYFSAYGDVFGSFVDINRVFWSTLTERLQSMIALLGVGIDATFPQLRIAIDRFKFFIKGLSTSFLPIFQFLLKDISDAFEFITTIFEDIGSAASQFPFKLRDKLMGVPVIGEFITNRIEERARRDYARLDAKNYLSGLQDEFREIDNLLFDRFQMPVDSSVRPSVDVSPNTYLADQERLSRRVARYNARRYGLTLTAPESYAPTNDRVLGFAGGLSPALLQQAFDAQNRFNERVERLADSMTAVEVSFSSLFSELEKETPRLREFFASLGQGFRGQGGSIISAGVSEAAGGLRKRLAEGALKGLGSLGASLLTGGLFYGAGALFGALGRKKPKEERIPDNIELIARNTSRSNDLLNKIINAGSNFIYAPASQLAYAGVSRAAFEDAGR